MRETFSEILYSNVDDRARFEDSLKKAYSGFSLARNKENEYINQHVFYMWTGYCLRLRHGGNNEKAI